MLDNFEHYRSRNLGRINDIQQQSYFGLVDYWLLRVVQLLKVIQQSVRPPKTCLDFDALPWNEIESSNIELLMNLSPLASLQKTHFLLNNFSRDIKKAQSSLLNCNKSIPHFPQAEWLNLLSGNSIDLDHVFSNICTISHNTTVKTVKTHEDWVIAWNCTVDATLFKHRKQELQTYRKHIQCYFASLSPLFHSRVISYDKAVRIKAAQRRDIELSYFSEFADLQLQWISNSPELTSGQLTDIGQD
jgi:hypothetical protein